MTPTVYTIGVYGLTDNEFFQRLVDNKIELFIDIRQRRAVRGSKYAFVNSKRLQARLFELQIEYLHILELAPTKEIRKIQHETVKEEGEKKNQRITLGTAFIKEYTNQILEKFDFPDLIRRLEDKQYQRIVLFCVESEAEACHRSLVSKKLCDYLDIKPINI